MEEQHQLASSIDIRIVRDIPYATESEAQKLDIYYMLPKREKPCPVVMWLHPGGFWHGDKDGSANRVLSIVNMIKLFQPMLERGYVGVSINYRLVEEAIFPALIFDAKAAIRWIKANAAEYNFDAGKIVAWGPSAGGYLAAMLATTSDVRELEDLSLGNPDQSSKVIAAVDWYGPTHFFHMDAHHEKLGQDADVHSPESPESRLMGAPVMTIPEKCDAASPITYVNSDSTPIVIQQGTDDLIIPYPQSIMLAEKMTAAIGKENVMFELVENADHSDPVFFTLKNIHKILDFLDKYLK